MIKPHSQWLPAFFLLLPVYLLCINLKKVFPQISQVIMRKITIANLIDNIGGDCLPRSFTHRDINAGIRITIVRQNCFHAVFCRT